MVGCLKEKYYCFMIIFVVGDNGEIKGFCCFIEGLYMCDLFECINILYFYLISKFGGYVMVVGLSINE